MRLFHRTLAVALSVSALAALGGQAPTRLMGAPYHDASRAFLDAMIPHHEMAIMMSRHAAAAARTEAVKSMAQAMVSAQEAEIAEMKRMRKSLFGSDSSRSSMMRGMMQMMGMDDMGHMRDSAAMRVRMDSMRGTQPMAMRGMAMPIAGDIDRMFLEHMISHHSDGIDMAILAEHSTAAPEVKAFAQKTRAGQERDIAQMRRLLATIPAPPRKP